MVFPQYAHIASSVINAGILFSSRQSRLLDLRPILGPCSGRDDQPERGEIAGQLADLELRDRVRARRINTAREAKGLKIRDLTFYEALLRRYSATPVSIPRRSTRASDRRNSSVPCRSTRISFGVRGTFRCS